MLSNLLKAKDALKSFRGLKLGVQLALLLVILVAVPVTVGLVSRFVLYRAQAASATLTFTPSVVSLSSSSPNAILTVNANVGSKGLVFSQIEVSFDRSHIRLSGEVDTSASPLSTIVQKTSMSEANSTGKIGVTSAVPGGSAAATGTVHMFRIPIRLNTTSSVQSQVTISKVQLIDLDGVGFSVTSTPVILNLNGTFPSPSPTPTSPPITPTPGGRLIYNLNVNDSANRADWSIQTNLQVGNTQYGDRNFTFTTIPSAYQGLEWIRTANNSKSYTGSTLATFNVSADATVYVAVDDRITSKPSWLSNWSDTGDNIINSESIPITYSIYSRNYSSGQTINLGPHGGDPSDSSMYTVIAKAIVLPTLTPTIPPPSPTIPPTPTTTPPPESLVVENFEGYGGSNSNLRNHYNYNGNTTVLSLSSNFKHDGSYSGKLDYIVGNPDFSGVWSHLPSHKTDWSAYNGMSFWVKGDGSRREIIVQFSENDGDHWEAYFTLWETAPQTLHARFNQFVKPAWNVTGDGIMELNDLSGFAFYVRSGINNTSPGSGTVYFDAFQATDVPVSTPTPPVTITPTPTDLIPGDADEDGDVDGEDYAFWFLFYRQATTQGHRQGDFDYSRFVDGLDYAIWFLNYTGQRGVTPTPTTGAEKRIYFDPSNITIAQGSTETSKIMVDVKNDNLVFAWVDFIFDTTKVRLAGEINTSNSPLATVVQKTSMSEANSTGEATLVIAASPGATNTGILELAELPLTSSSFTGTSQITFDFTQLIDSNNNEIIVTKSPLTVDVVFP